MEDPALVTGNWDWGLSSAEVPTWGCLTTEQGRGRGLAEGLWNSFSRVNQVLLQVKALSSGAASRPGGSYPTPPSKYIPSSRALNTCIKSPLPFV